MIRDIEIPAGEKRDMMLLNRGESLHIVQHAGSVLHLCLFHLDDSDADYSITVEQAGEGCETHLSGLIITRGRQHVDCLTRVRHLVGKGTSRQLFKYIVADQSRDSFTGELYIAPDAQQTDAQQTNRNLLLSRDARIQTKPQLEIYADDVKASHGASTGQIDDSALFYMQQRCLSLAQARRLLMEAFANEVLSHIPAETEFADPHGTSNLSPLTPNLSSAISDRLAALSL